PGQHGAGVAGQRPQWAARASGAVAYSFHGACGRRKRFPPGGGFFVSRLGVCWEMGRRARRIARESAMSTTTISLHEELEQIGRQARRASNALRSLSRSVKDAALLAIAARLRAEREILKSE